MIKIANKLLKWKSSDFIYPVVTGYNYTNVTLNHNLGVEVNSYRLIHKLSETEQAVIPDFTRSGTVFYFYKATNSETKNVLNLELYRYTSGPSPYIVYASLFYYGL